MAANGKINSALCPTPSLYSDVVVHGFTAADSPGRQSVGEGLVAVPSRLGPRVVTREHVVDADDEDDEGRQQVPLAEEVQVEDVEVDEQRRHERRRHAEQHPEAHPARTRVHAHHDGHEEQAAERQPRIPLSDGRGER